MKLVDPTPLRASSFACNETCTTIETDYPTGLPLDGTQAATYRAKKIEVPWIMHTLTLEGVMSLASTWAERCLAATPADFVADILALIATPTTENAETLREQLCPHRRHENAVTKKQALFGWAVTNTIIAWNNAFDRTSRRGGTMDMLEAHLRLFTDSLDPADHETELVVCYGEILDTANTAGSEFLVDE